MTSPRSAQAALLRDGLYRVTPGSPLPYCEVQVVTDAARLLGLTAAETDILVMLHDGFSDRMIAHAYNACLPGVRRTVRAIKRKLGVDRRIQAAVRWQAAIDVILNQPQRN